MDTLPWSRSGALSGDRLRLLDRFVDEIRFRFASNFFPRDRKKSVAYEFSLPSEAIPRDTLTVETVLELLLSFFFGAAGVPTILPFCIAQIPSLARMAAAQARITSVIVAAVATRPIVTLHDLEREVCRMEGVEAFAELGFGRQLHALPVVQQYFKLPPSQSHAPVTAEAFLAFLCYGPATHDEPLRTLETDGDARDVVNAFAQWYARGAASQGRPCLHNNRQLGVHIQSLPALRLLLRQYTADATRSAEAIVTQATTQLTRNHRLYTRVVESLDRAVAASVLSPSDVGGSSSWDGVPIECRVNMSEAEAALTTVPRALWHSAPRDAAHGGLCLTLSITSPSRAQRAHTCSVGHATPAETARTAGQNPTACGTAALPSSHADADTRVPSPALRRRGRVIVSTASPTAAPNAGAHARPVSSPLPDFGLGPLGLVNTTVASCASPAAELVGSGAKESAEEAAPKTAAKLSSSLEKLSACVAMEDDAHFAEKTLDVLGCLCPGDPLEPTVVRRTFTRLARLTAAHRGESWLEDWLASCRDAPFIPLTVSKGVTHVVSNVVAPSEVYWSSATSSSSPADTEPVPVAADVQAWLALSLDTMFLTADEDEEACLRHFFCTDLGVSAVPTLRCWLAAVYSHKRHGANRQSSLPHAFTELTLRALDVCVRSEWRAHLAAVGGDGKAALERLLVSVPRSEVVDAAVFPVDGRWRCGLADLFFCGPTYMRCSDMCALTAATEGPKKAPPLLVLAFETEPHFAVQAVLEHFGVRPVDTWVTKTVWLDTEAFVDTALDIHRRLQLVLPYVQAYIRTTHPSLYGLASEAVAHRLQSMRVVLGRQATMRAALRNGDVEYAMERSFPLLYVSQHNTLYGEDSACTPHVLADALCWLFLPLTPDPVVVSGLRQVLGQLLSVVTSATGGLLSEERLAALEERVAEEAVHTLGISLPPPDSREDVHWALSAAPFVRYQAHFPPGTDGTSSPAPFHRPHAVPSLRTAHETHAAKTSAADGSEAVPSPATLLMSFSPHTAEREWARSVPQWQSSLYADLYDGLQGFLRAARSDAQEGVPREQRAPPDASAPRAASGTAGVSASERGMSPNAPPVTTTPQRRDFLSFASHEPFPGEKRGRASESLAVSGGSRAGGPVRTYRGSDESAAAVASEAFVYEKLVAEYAAQDPSIRVLWVNGQREHGTPYDILVVRQRPGSQDVPNIVAFVEVKSTTQAHRADFEMSLRELLFAARYGSTYQVHRVFKASATRPEQMRVQVLTDLVSMWHRGKLSMTGEVRVMPAVQDAHQAGV